MADRVVTGMNGLKWVATDLQIIINEYKAHRCDFLNSGPKVAGA